MTASLAEYYHWEETDKGVRIYMHARMADRLQAEVLQRGEEVGGILLGRVQEDRGLQIAFIDDFVPVTCSYSSGQLYDLSGDDTVKLEAALLRTALAGCESPAAPSVLGYYRSHLRDGMSLSAADLLLIDSYFQAPASVFLLLKSVAGSKACTAGFFFWEDGRVQSEFSSLEVALGRMPSSPPAPGAVPDTDIGFEVELPAGVNDAFKDDLPADLAEMLYKTVPLAVPRAQPRKTPRVWPGWLARAATILIATAALVISVVTYLGAPRPPREEAAAIPAVSMLGLHVERNPPDLLLTWNRNAREILAARRATLSIRDGRIEKKWDLDKPKLAGGSFLVTPASDDIQVRLEVYGVDDGSVAQSIRVSTGGPR